MELLLQPILQPNAAFIALKPGEGRKKARRVSNTQI
jgi:hypothetical protein